MPNFSGIINPYLTAPKKSKEGIGNDLGIANIR
jgi:hypothetical protein